MKRFQGRAYTIGSALFLGFNISLLVRFISNDLCSKFNFVTASIVLLLEVLLYLMAGQGQNDFIFYDVRIMVHNPWYWWRKDVYMAKDLIKVETVEKPRKLFRLILTTPDRKVHYSAGIKAADIDEVKGLIKGLGF
jgi:hypothetical protein